ncbi:PREDICTED: cytochrome b561 and DOMON domain-containing protein At2g04850 [Tarenaya hassleriana]|uniref:cytochrome b561 and DOMON domain-containing protein At2g04850 n=1 Tax=Tarenaya hassleriana TaxID=28532 RepID=UPI00053C4A81|nr:PREDICTED: cytochrome b561 and DOMON domain-containing protein At2g04850 [Tarenaya hassleriana]
MRIHILTLRTFPLRLLLLLAVKLPASAAGRCVTTTATRTFEKCVSLPTQQASIAWTYHPGNATLDVCFFGTFISPSGWVGWGINPSSPEMTGSRVLVAFPDPNSGQLILLPYILDPSVKLQKSPLLSRPLDLRLHASSASLYGGDMATIRDGASVQIYASIKLPSNKTKIHHVWNRGLYVQGYSPTIHPTTSIDLSSFATFDVSSGFASVNRHTDSRTLKVIHGIVNAAAWGVLLPGGAVVARYLRHMNSAGPTWFYAHAAIQLAGFLLGTVGFSIGIILGRESPGITYTLHRNLGIATFAAATVQTLALLFRPKTTNKFRRYWKSYHHFVGYGCVVMGVVNVFQGFEVMGEGGSFAKLGYCLCLSTLIGVCVAMEVNSWVVFCRKAKEEKMKREVLTGISSCNRGSGILN